MAEWIEKSLGEIAEVTKLAGFEFTKYIKYNDDGEIIALRAFEYESFQYDTFKPEGFSFDTFETDTFEPDTLDITFLRRGVIGVSKVGYVM